MKSAIVFWVGRAVCLLSFVIIWNIGQQCYLGPHLVNVTGGMVVVVVVWVILELLSIRRTLAIVSREKEAEAQE